MMAQKQEPRPLGRVVDEEILKADLESYRSLALELGASDAVIIPAISITVDERVRLKCTIPRCPRAGETPNCPPYAPDLELVRQAINRYSQAILFKCHVSPYSSVMYPPLTTTSLARVLLKLSSDVYYSFIRKGVMCLMV
jgi:predicted metal-binding protein